MRLEDGTMVCCFDLKKSRKSFRTWLLERICAGVVIESGRKLNGKVSRGRAQVLNHRRAKYFSKYYLRKGAVRAISKSESVNDVLWKLKPDLPCPVRDYCKSLNRSKTINGAGVWLWTTRLYWKSKAARRVPHVV